MNQSLSIKNYSAPFAMNIAAGVYTAPPSTESTGNFKISILRNGWPMQVGYQILTAIPSTTITGALSSRGSPIVNRVTTYTFSITLNDPIGGSGKIRITFPSEVIIITTDPSCATITSPTGSNIVSTPTCLINPITRTI